MFFQSVPSFTLVLSLDIKYSSFYVLSACAGGLREIKKKKELYFLRSSKGSREASSVAVVLIQEAYRLGRGLGATETDCQDSPLTAKAQAGGCPRSSALAVTVASGELQRKGA